MATATMNLMVTTENEKRLVEKYLCRCGRGVISADVSSYEIEVFKNGDDGCYDMSIAIFSRGARGDEQDCIVFDSQEDDWDDSCEEYLSELLGNLDLSDATIDNPDSLIYIG